FECMLVAAEDVVQDAAAVLSNEVTAHRARVRAIEQSASADPRVGLIDHEVALDHLCFPLLVRRPQLGLPGAMDDRAPVETADARPAPEPLVEGEEEEDDDRACRGDGLRHGDVDS